MPLLTTDQLNTVDKMIRRDEKSAVIYQYLASVTIGEDASLNQYRCFIKGFITCRELAQYKIEMIKGDK